MALAFRRYQRQFLRPLQTAHGPWRDRQGIILRLRTASGETGYGEIAPIPRFGTETLEEAIAFLTKLQATVPAETATALTMGDLSTAMEQLPTRYSTTRFGLGLAIALLQGSFPPSPPEPQPQQICALLPTGPAALQAWPELWQRGHRTFKWKIGVADLGQELTALTALRRSLPASARLRLDANGSLTLEDAKALLHHCDDLAGVGQPIEFVEQPLPPAQFGDLLNLSQAYQTMLALDESVTGLAQLQDCYERGWRGIFVVKGAIAGDPQALIRYCRSHPLKLVFSSVFETDLARQAVFAVAQAIQHSDAQNHAPQNRSSQNHDYALGFGVEHWLKPDGLTQLEHSVAHRDIVEINARGKALWQRLLSC